jgi:hypothetical protein
MNSMMSMLCSFMYMLSIAVSLGLCLVLYESHLYRYAVVESRKCTQFVNIQTFISRMRALSSPLVRIYPYVQFKAFMKIKIRIVVFCILIPCSLASEH